MKLADHLSHEQRKKLEHLNNHHKKPPSKKKKKPKKKQEKVNWKDIMGMNRDIYKRAKGGAIRSK